MCNDKAAKAVKEAFKFIIATESSEIREEGGLELLNLGGGCTVYEMGQQTGLYRTLIKAYIRSYSRQPRNSLT